MTSFANLNIIELKEYNKEDNMNISIEKESQDILKQLSKTNSYNILLDLNGKELSSEDMSEYIEDLKNKGTSSINFIIGGSNGVNKELKNSVDMKLKFSHFTFPHQLMRLILLEQVYRWFAISNNIKYHKQGDEIIKGNFILTTKDSFNEECVEELIGEIEGELKEDLENIKGLELSKKYFYDLVLPEFEKNLNDILPLCAFGLVGEGSECYGYDDKISQDHDFGPSVCIWLRKDDYLKHKDKINEVLKKLPKTYLGFQELKESEWGSDRRGLLNIEDFYFKFLGSSKAPETIADWQKIPETALATVTNGEVFLDNLGEFTKVRKDLLNYYPEPMRQNKIATRLMNISQHGQYNYTRCLKRNDLVAANQCLYLFVDEVIHLVFLLNRRYKIFYKWSNRALLDLKILGEEIHKLLEDMVFAQNKIPYVRKICKVLAEEIRNQKLTNCSSEFLGDLGVDIQKNIDDEFFKNYSPWLD